MATRPHIVSMVFNSVKGDSRVIKTAQAALNLGCRATIVGTTRAREVEFTEIDGVSVVLVPNFSVNLGKKGLWGGQQGHDLRLLMGGYIQSAIPHIIELRPDLLHSHDMIGLKIGVSAQKALLSGGRLVPWVHDLHEFVAGLKGELAEEYMPICLGWEREFLHHADHLFTVSDALALEVQRRYFLSDTPTVTYNTPNFNVFKNEGDEIRGVLGLDARVPLVVFVGGATQLRGCDTILEGVARLEGVHLVFISQGKYVAELQERAANIGMNTRFHVHPYVESDQVSTFIRTANIGIHGLVHYPNAEVAMPNKMFEYLHAGLPMVVSDVACMKEFVEKHGLGLSFIADDAASCSEKIRELLDHESNFRSAISLKFQNQYSWEQQEKKIQSIYNILLAREQLCPSRAEREAANNWFKYEAILFESAFARKLAEVCIQQVVTTDKQTQKNGVRLAKIEAAQGDFSKIIQCVLKDDNLVKSVLNFYDIKKNKSSAPSNIKYPKINRFISVVSTQGLFAALKMLTNAFVKRLL